MPENSLQLRLDPWSASSLLQKAIRRGEIQIAQAAAQSLHRQRGAAIWRRLSAIAVEDVGIADVGLVQEVTRIATDKALRAVLGPDAQLIDDLSLRMATATKDRSADYLYCAATKLETAWTERRELARLPFDKLVNVASDDHVPITRRAVAALLACAIDGGADGILNPDQVERLLDALPVKSLPLHDATRQLARIRAHPFCLMLPLIWSRWWHFGAGGEVVEEKLPISEFVCGVPLYTFDKHTAAGKQAISRFARENADMKRVLSRWVAKDKRIPVAEMAAFYTDAMPVSRKLRWACSEALEELGRLADMGMAGCPFDGVHAVLAATRSNLEDLNGHRRRAHARA